MSNMELPFVLAYEPEYEDIVAHSHRSILILVSAPFIWASGERLSKFFVMSASNIAQ